MSDYPLMQVAPDEAKEVAYSDGIEALPQADLDALKTASSPDQVQESAVRSSAWLSRRRIWVILALIALVVIIAVVLGGVLGSRHHNTATVLPSTPSLPTSIVPPASSSTHAYQGDIAAVSFMQNSQNTTRVYFQNVTGGLVEAAQNGSTWINKELGVSARNGSPIAAAVDHRDYPLTIDLYFVDSANLIHNIYYSSWTALWTAGNISSQGYTICPNCTLSVMFDWCTFCANNTIIVFQDDNFDIQIGNLTASGWQKSQLNGPAPPVTGTGLALQPYYTGTQHLGTYTWDQTAATLEKFAFGSPLAAASSYNNFSNGDELWIQVLSLSSSGVAVQRWLGEEHNWQQSANPTAMGNSTSDPKTYGAIAVTAKGAAFAVVSIAGESDTIESFQVDDDYLDWSPTGSVDVGAAWG